MARGTKTDEEKIIEIFVSYASSGSYSATAKEMQMPVNTVKGIIIRNKDKPKFAKLLDEKKEEYVESATEIVKKATLLLNRKLDRAIERETELDMLIDEICDTDEEILDEKQKEKLIRKIEALKIISPGELARVMGIYYDKRSLAKGEVTENVKIEVGLTD